MVVGGVVYARVVEGDKRGTESQLQETVDLIFSTLVFAIFGLSMCDRKRKKNRRRGRKS